MVIQRKKMVYIFFTVSYEEVLCTYSYEYYVIMAGAVRTPLSCPCLSIFCFWFWPCIFLSSVLSFLPFMLCVGVFDGWQILFFNIRIVPLYLAIHRKQNPDRFNYQQLRHAIYYDKFRVLDPLYTNKHSIKFFRVQKHF